MRSILVLGPWLFLAACADHLEFTVSQTAEGLRPSRCPDSPEFCDPATLDTVPIGKVTITTDGELEIVQVTLVSGPLLFSLSPTGQDKRAPFGESFVNAADKTTATIYVFATTCEFETGEFLVGGEIFLRIEPLGGNRVTDDLPASRYTVTVEGAECVDPPPGPGPDDCPNGVLFTVADFPAGDWEMTRTDATDGVTLTSSEAADDGLDEANDPEPTHRRDRFAFAAGGGGSLAEFWQRYVGPGGTPGDPSVPGPVDPAFVYDPSVRGALTALQMKIKTLGDSKFEGAQVFLVIYQDHGGVLHRYFARAFTVTNGAWISHDTGRLGIGEFVVFAGSPPLDFSENGGPISFGYALEFSEQPGGELITVYLDDFEISAFCDDE